MLGHNHAMHPDALFKIYPMMAFTFGQHMHLVALSRASDRQIVRKARNST